MGKLFLRAPGNYDADKASDEAGLACSPDDCVTQQQFAEECDINTIVRRFGLTGELPETFAMPVSGDFTEVVDFQSAMNVVRAAEEAFMQIPAETRARFANDPARLYEFLNDSGNRDEARKLGLLRPEPEKDRTDVLIEAVRELKPPPVTK